MERILGKIKTQFEGIHCYPEAGNYLASPHRHMFYVEVTVQLRHDNRDVEFIQLKHHVNDFLRSEWGFGGELGAMSCEMMSRAILNFLNDSLFFKERFLGVWVYEDGENGAGVEFSPDEVLGGL